LPAVLLVIAPEPAIAQWARRPIELGHPGFRDFARKYYGQGMSEGLEKGREEGREEGLRAAVVALAQTKIKTVLADDLAKLAAITDLRVLTDLVSALGQAHTAFGARATLARALNR
jgi:hypothetical protein